MRERGPELAVVDREPIARAARVLLGQMVDDGHVVVGGGRVEPEVERERIGAVVVADVASHEAAIRLVEEQRLAAHAGAEQWALDDGGCVARRRGRRQRQRLRRCSCAARAAASSSASRCRRCSAVSSGRPGAVRRRDCAGTRSMPRAECAACAAAAGPRAAQAARTRIRSARRARRRASRGFARPRPSGLAAKRAAAARARLGSGAFAQRHIRRLSRRLRQPLSCSAAAVASSGHGSVGPP